MILIETELVDTITIDICYEGEFAPSFKEVNKFES